MFRGKGKAFSLSSRREKEMVSRSTREKGKKEGRRGDFLLPIRCMRKLERDALSPPKRESRKLQSECREKKKR